MDALIILSRFVHFAALAVLFGGSLFRLCVEAQQQNREHRWPAIIDIAAAVATLISAAGWLVGVAATMADDWAELLMPDTMAAVLLDTRFGRVWTGRLSLAAGILLLAFAVRGRTRDMMMLLMSAALTASLGSVGHGSAGAGILGPIHFAGDVIHLLCAAAWLGGLLGLALILHRASKRGDDRSLDFVRRTVPTFSRLGYGAVGLLVVTGILNAIVLVPRPELLITTPYGQVLLVKVSLDFIMIAIAARNRFILTPQIVSMQESDRAHQATAALYRSVAVEQGVGLFVLASVAVLGTIHPSQ